MGQYLAQPVKEKASEEGSGFGVRYGASAMQGWRLHMEDAHIAQFLTENTKAAASGASTSGSEGAKVADHRAALFAVFDGHGGREVALFCKRYMPRELKKLPAFQNGDFELALKQVFHRMDVMIDDESNYAELEMLRTDTMTQPDSDPMDRSPEVSDWPLSSKQKESMGTEGTNNLNSKKNDNYAIIPAPSNNTPSISTVTSSGSSSGSSSSPSMDSPRMADAGMVISLPEGPSAAEKKKQREENQQRAPLQDALALLQKLAENSVIQGQGMNDFGRNITNDIETMQHNTEQDRLAHICRLDDHRIAAGCTAVVALLIDNSLYVANAGDSKAVLCRGGKAHPLSFEHKPQSDIEKARIEKAGGFVNPAGRVNNNLNLSRSIGDLKYKMNRDLPPEAQMITAEPDMAAEKLLPEDEFLFMACDGVWDVMSNQEAIDFVRVRLSQGETSLSKICEQVFDQCISEDPRRTSGLGGDNMTCVIVQFNVKQ
eukprot:CAMPEP_0184694404 /NCGR_PEP_ID=MMETSP0313-20130426/2382_1 /TAXON_ID=2792 /ORGANISM="Porphyridium aerugineum, Strain SAG 1380-2" /LENGTH=485 /DNA_ID=CAMNT_0027152695 /DNA_START=459 /DNA_END=1916 /DNA_ORIENTATION=+